MRKIYNKIMEAAKWLKQKTIELYCNLKGKFKALLLKLKN